MLSLDMSETYWTLGVCVFGSLFVVVFCLCFLIHEDSWKIGNMYQF
jgi:hypothetical protein